MSAPAELSIGGPLSARETGLWAAAAAFVVFAHVAVSMAFQVMTSSEPEIDATEAMVVEMAQLPFAASMPVDSEIVSEEPPVDAAEPQVSEEIVEEEVAEIVPEEQPDEVQPEEIVQETAPVKPDAMQEEVAEKVEPAEMTEEIAEPVISEIVIPQPRPERVAEVEEKIEPEPKKEEPKKRAEKKPVKKAEKPAEKPVEKKPTKKAETKREAKASAQQAVQSKAATAQNVNPAKWHVAVRRAIARRTGNVRGMRGNVRVYFVVSASGSIVSASVAGSSGNGKLDSAALKMVRSARVPAPPADLPGSSHDFTIPLSFD